MSRNLGPVLCFVAFNWVADAQVTAKIDFERDVQPILKANCYGCHGPSQQMNNFRLDRRHDAMRGGTIAVIAPGSSQSSHLYLRLIGHDRLGLPMPPTGSLPAEQIETIKNWIDQGAVWPDAAAGETPPPPPDPKAVRLMEALRAGDRQNIHTLLKDRAAVKAKGTGGSTPLMYAVLYADTTTVRQLLDAGADPNIRNDSGATALMWAATDLEKARLLVAHGADVNARSEDGRTPVMIAARRNGNQEIVKLLLEHGANPSAKTSSIIGEVTPIGEAMYAGDESIFRLLLDHGADRAVGPAALALAFRARCPKCIEDLIGPADPGMTTHAAFLASPPLGPGFAVKALLDRGADAKAKGPDGLSLLMVNAASEALPLDSVRALIDKGADLNAKWVDGRTALDFAARNGETPVVDLLRKAGAKPGEGPGIKLDPSPAPSARAAVERALPVLQKSDDTFLRKAGCVSCHNDALAALAVAGARRHGIRVDEDEARRQVTTIAKYIDTWRERALQGIAIPGDADTVSAVLLGLAAENYPADAATDAMAYYVKNQQMPDGHWLIFANRPPIESSDIQITAISLRVLQVYGIKTLRPDYEKSIQAAAVWLEHAQPHDTQDRAFRLMGLNWAHAHRDVIDAAARDLIAQQRPDGGWSQTATLGSDAYATGQALVALEECGALGVNGRAAKQAGQFLLNSQLADGSWYVRSRAIPLQPYFESDFPHGHDQWISPAATAWSIQALGDVMH